MDVSEISNNEMIQCMLLTHDTKSGYAKMCLDLCYSARVNYKKTDFVCDLYFEKEGEIVIGWAMVQNLLYARDGYLDLSIFVHKDHRRKGVASKLMNRIAEGQYTKMISVWVDDDANYKLFKRFNHYPFVAFSSSDYTLFGAYVKKTFKEDTIDLGFTDKNKECGCSKCNPDAWWMIVCSSCGNKRCPHATDHKFVCTGSNEPGQEGSVY